jgi:hypothetical protein
MRVRWRAHQTYTTVILRSRALARRLEGWATTRFHPSRLAAKGGEHLRMTASDGGHGAKARLCPPYVYVYLTPGKANA